MVVVVKMTFQGEKMRKMKFKAWHKKRRVMYHNVCFDSYGYPRQVRGPEIDTLDFVKRDDCDLLQFTGLRDKNDEEIYEGDIIKYDYDQRHSPKITSVEFIESPIEVEGGFGGVWTGYCLDPEICEIIGNVYENPELINYQRNGGG